MILGQLRIGARSTTYAALVTPCHTSLHIVPFCYSPVPLSVWSPWLPSSPWSSGHPGCPGYLHHLGHPGHPHHTHYSPHPGRFDLPSLPFSPCSVVTQVTLVQCTGPICQIQVGLLFNRMCMIAISALRGPRLHPLEGFCLPRRDAARSLRGLRLDSLWHISNVGHISGIIPLSPLISLTPLT